MTETTKTTTTKSHPSPEWFLAGLLTCVVVGLHFYLFSRTGGLWRDEVNSLNIAQGGWQKIGQDSFPFLFPTWLRAWAGIGFGESDWGLRFFGLVMGLSVTGAFWISAWWLRRRPPLWSLVLVALNSWVIIYDSSLRAYGLGSAMIALCAGAAWFFLAQPGKKSWLLFAFTAILSVQTLFQNTALVAAICAGAVAVAWRQRKIRLAGGIFLGGLGAAISLLPYCHSIFDITHATSPVRTDFNRFTAANNLNTLLEFPLRQFFWVWLGLAGVVLARALGGFFSAHRNDRALFAAVTIIIGFLAFAGFLRLANFYVQPWYFLPLLALAAVAFENALPRLEGKFRSVLWGGVLATAMMSAMFSVRLLDYRFTNLDLLAKKITDSAHAKDFVVVKTWPFGITFSHYFKNACAWTTIPPLTDHATHRYDLLAEQMRNPQAMAPLLSQTAATLRAGNTVWIIGGVGAATATNVPPLQAAGWNEMVSSYNWNRQLDDFLRQHCRAIECVDPGTNEAVNYIERAPLFKTSGWND